MPKVVEAYSVEELAALLNLRAATVSHHLGFLKYVGLVSARAEGYYNVYHLEEQALQEKAKRLFSPQDLDKAIQEVDLQAYNHKVIADFSREDGSLKEIPAQRKKLEIVLRHIVRKFDPQVRYSEKQVNEVLSQFHPDSAALRRYLVEDGLIRRERDGSRYWREVRHD